jgi:RNA polymerase sigma factor (TIGR02999 family)
MSEVTHILSAIDAGDSHAAEQLLPLVYDELRRLAAAKLAQEKPGQTLQATALVHEAYIRLVAGGGPERADEPRWNSRGHFFAAAAEAMRRILVEKARRKHRLRRGGDWKRLELEKLDLADDQMAEQVLALDEALEKLAAEEKAAADLVQLRYFAGITIEKAAAALGVSVRTANRHWAYAKAWLFQQLGQQGKADQ